MSKIKMACVRADKLMNLTEGKVYEGELFTMNGVQYFTVCSDDVGAASSYAADRFIPIRIGVDPNSMFKRGLNTVGTSISRFLRDHDILDRPIPTGHEALKELGASEPSFIPLDRHMEQTRFMKFWRDRSHMNIHEATKAYAEVVADAERKPPLSVIYRVGRAPAKNFTDTKPFYYGDDARAAIDAAVIAIEENPNTEIYIGKFVNSPVDDGE